MPDVTSQFSRRSLLKAGLFGGLFVVAGSVVLARRGSKLREPVRGLRVLDAQEYAVLAAVAARLLPGNERAPSAEQLRVASSIDALFADREPDVQKGLKLSLLIVENALAGALFGERITPFTQLSSAEQDRALEALRESSLTVRRSVFVALDALVSAVYFGDERTFASVGYPGPPDARALRTMYAENLVDLAALKAPPANGAR